MLPSWTKRNVRFLRKGRVILRGWCRWLSGIRGRTTKSRGVERMARQTDQARRVVFRWYSPSIQDMTKGTDTPANPVPACEVLADYGLHPSVERR